MIPRTQQYSWGTHTVNLDNISITLEISQGQDIDGILRTKVAKVATNQEFIAEIRGPSVQLSVLEAADTITLSNQKTVSVPELLEAVERFFEVAYDRAYAESQSP